MARHGNLQKYENPNPVQRWLLGRFLQQVAVLSTSLGATSVLDAGCAEGFVSRSLRQTWAAQVAFYGVDMDGAALRRGQTLTPWMQRAHANVMRLPFADEQFDLVLCNEVLEHLTDPGTALRELHRVTRRYVLLSVPHEPWFRTLNFLRGKHIHHWGNDPEHVQNWTARRFVEFVEYEFDIKAVRLSFPWLVVLAE